MKKITVLDIMDWEPRCAEYNLRKVQELIGDGKTVLEILDLDIAPKDKMWVVFRSGVDFAKLVNIRKEIYGTIGGPGVWPWPEDESIVNVMKIYFKRLEVQT